MTCIKIILQFSGYLKSCHPRHQHITDYQISIIRTCTFQSRRTIRLGHNFKILSHFFFQKLTYIVIIFYNKYFTLIKWCRWKFHAPFLRRYFFCKNSCMMYFLLFQQHIMGNQKIFFLINRNISRQTDRKYRPTTFIFSIYYRTFMYTHQFMCQMQADSDTTTRKTTLHKTLK